MLTLKTNVLKYKDVNGVMQTTDVLLSPNSNTGTDTSLTQSGVPADAKAVGDRLAKITEVTAESIEEALGYTPVNPDDITDVVRGTVQGDAPSRRLILKDGSNSSLPVLDADEKIRDYQIPDNVLGGEIITGTDTSTNESYRYINFNRGSAKSQNIPLLTGKKLPAYFIPDTFVKDSELSNYALKSAIPKNPADIGAETFGTADVLISNHNTNEGAHNDIRLLFQELSTKVSNFLDTDEETMDELSELITAIGNNKSTIESLTTGKVNVADIVNDLVTSVTNKPLSAKQGVELKKLIDALDTQIKAIKVPTKVSELTEDSTHRTVTDTEKNTWNNKLSQDDLANAVANIGGGIEVTSGNPTKENTVLTINPDEEEVSIYTTEEVDSMLSEVSKEIVDLKAKLVDGNEVAY